ncbi:alpha-1,2-mannosyltransferase ALG9 isoform X3 [Belonocnema kinseyi]|uniref:alpha-1,2-mannosyltransferase ALG9 isoform X3 n=1 Tax=Belonocnema kinseyi TaxID=2817044 RepID=UPI00143D346C|nr:alpha-1,2-mannosyltransferase ALG9 isoform X3 [Belonocnema kinseyi]
MVPGVRQRQLCNLKKDQKKNNIKKMLKPDEPSDIRLIYPSGDTAFKMLLSARFCSAMWCHITDCDETYNYWEPSHYLLYGNGQQTWEYSPQYALRSYTYLLIHLVPAKLYHYLLEPNPVLVFYFIRCLLSVGCALSEVYFYKNVCREFGVHIARMTLAFLLLSPGMYISSAAFLPSAFSMYLCTVAISAWYARKYELAIFATAVSALIGWPFAALLGLPIAIEMTVHRREWTKFFKWTLLSAIVILLPMVWIDSVHFGKLVIAPLNIVMYNIFTNHGPNIYGTEPFTFYFFNGFLNFNFVFIGALLAPILLIFAWALIPAKPRHYLCLPYEYSLAPLFLWILIFFIQRHKEERFLFPIYPMICLAGSISLDNLQKLYFFFRTKIKPLPDHERNTHYLQFTPYITFLAIFIYGIFGLSRSFALYRGYYAPIEVMMEANKLGMEGLVPQDVNINFCVGKEWYRFPTSFFFPSSNFSRDQGEGGCDITYIYIYIYISIGNESGGPRC